MSHVSATVTRLGRDGDEGAGDDDVTGAPVAVTEPEGLVTDTGVEGFFAESPACPLLQAVNSADPSATYTNDLRARGPMRPSPSRSSRS